MGRGFVKHLTGEEITLTLDKRLRRAFRPEEQHSSASSLGEARSSSAPPIDEHGTSQQHSWRLDKDDVASVFVRLRRNLMGKCRLGKRPQSLTRARKRANMPSAQPLAITVSKHVHRQLIGGASCTKRPYGSAASSMALHGCRSLLSAG